MTDSQENESSFLLLLISFYLFLTSYLSYLQPQRKEDRLGQAKILPMTKGPKEIEWIGTRWKGAGACPR